jgi:hypothetical protein
MGRKKKQLKIAAMAGMLASSPHLAIENNSQAKEDSRKYQFSDSHLVANAFNSPKVLLTQNRAERKYLDAFFDSEFNYDNADLVSQCMDISLYRAKIKIGAFISEDGLDAATHLIVECAEAMQPDESDILNAFFDQAGFSYKDAEVFGQCFRIDTYDAKLKIGRIIIKHGVDKAKPILRNCQNELNAGYSERQLIDAFFATGLDYYDAEMISKCFQQGNFYDAKLKIGRLKLEEGISAVKALKANCQTRINQSGTGGYSEEELLMGYVNTGFSYPDTKFYAECFGVSTYDMKLKIGLRKYDVGDHDTYFANECPN